VLERILDWSLGHRFLVLCAWTAIALGGVTSALILPLDALPDTTPVQVQVNSVAPALGPLEIERQITAPIEATLSGLPALVEIRSVSKFGFAQITLTFADETDVYRARQVTLERVLGAELPPGIERPTLGPVATGLGEVFHYLVGGAGHTLGELRAAQDWIVKPRLRAVPGVAEVNSWGGDEQQVHVIVDPLDLQRYDLKLSDLADALSADNANVGGGTLDRAGEAAIVQGVAIATGLEDVGGIVVASREGVPVRVRDVGRVVPGREIRRGAVTANGEGEIVLGLGFMLPGQNSREVARGLRLALEEIRKALPAGIELQPAYDRTDLVHRVLRTVGLNLAEGAVLVVAVLFLFLGHLRAGLIVASAIPLSMLCASSLMLQAGIAGSLMSLGAIDFGLVVDSTVIQVENVVRRLGLERDQAARLAAVRAAVLEVRRPTLLGEAVIAVVYLPILTLTGIEGKLFRPMALTVLFALAGSLALSLTLIPVLASLGLGGRGAHRENALVRALQRAYRPLLRAALDHPRAVLGAGLLLLAGAGLVAARLGSEFVPRLREGTIVINTIRLAGVAVDESVRYGLQIERALLERFPDEIERVWSRSGTAEVATDPMGLELTDVFVVLRPDDGWTRARTQEQLVQAMAEELSGWPGMKAVFTQPIEMRVNEMIAGIRADLGVRLFGDDFAVLEAKAREIESALRLIPGASDVFVEQVTGQPVLRVEVDRDAAARYGVPAREILAVVEALGTPRVGTLQDGERRIPIALRLDPRYRDEEALGTIALASAGGGHVALGQLVHLRTEQGPATIQREWGKRRIVIQANVRGRDLGGFVAEARRLVAREVELPPGYFVRFGGQFEHLARAQTRLLLVVPAALALIFALLLSSYGRWLDAARVFSGVPFAAVGGIAALWLRGLPFSVSAGVGFVVLAGVSVLGDMVLVSTIRRGLAAGLAVRSAVERAALERLRPVLMTSLVASLGFLPMALNTGFGAEVQRPLATVVVGGVISSMLLTLVALPAFYVALRRDRRPG